MQINVAPVNKPILPVGSASRPVRSQESPGRGWAGPWPPLSLSPGHRMGLALAGRAQHPTMHPCDVLLGSHSRTHRPLPALSPASGHPGRQKVHVPVRKRNSHGTFPDLGGLGRPATPAAGSVPLLPHAAPRLSRHCRSEPQQRSEFPAPGSPALRSPVAASRGKQDGCSGGCQHRFCFPLNTRGWEPAQPPPPPPPAHAEGPGTPSPPSPGLRVRDRGPPEPGRSSGMQPARRNLFPICFPQEGGFGAILGSGGMHGVKITSMAWEPPRSPNQRFLPKARLDPNLRPGRAGEPPPGAPLPSEPLEAQLLSEVVFVADIFSPTVSTPFCEICCCKLLPPSPPPCFSLATAAGKPETMEKGL